MRRTATFLAMVAALALAACAPVATITPTEQISNLSFDEAFRKTVTAINSQPYPADTGGWVITTSDQVGGFISAELNGRAFVFFQGNVPYRALVSVSLVSRTETTTSVNVSGNNEKEAGLLMANIRSALGLN